MNRNTYRYSLDNTSKKFICPQCGKRTHVRYKNIEQNSYLPEKYGRCDRECSCGYHLSPKIENFSNDDSSHYELGKVLTKQINAEELPVYIPSETVHKTINGRNNFLTYLRTFLDADVVNKLIEVYKIGSANIFNGANIFYYIDHWGRATAGSILNYDSNGNRVKHQNHSVHALLKLGTRPSRCLFGLHQLNNQPLSPIAICEAPKTAIIAAGLMPEFIWMAAGALSWLTTERCMPLKGHRVVLFPDKGLAYHKWKTKAKELEKIGIQVSVSNILENTTLDEGADIADYLILQAPTVTSGLLSPKELQKLCVEHIGYHNHAHSSKLPYFNQMLESGLITPAKPLINHYYLTGSTPF